MSTLDRVKFVATSSGAGAFVPASAIPGFLTPAGSGMANGTLLSYTAQNPSNVTQWEYGYSSYTVSGTSIARAPLRSSSGLGTACSFSAPPIVAIGPLEENLKSGLNVRLFGATGDGSTDDSTAILNTINAAVATGQSVYFPPGQFRFSVSISRTNVTTFQGDVKGGSICIPLGTTQPCFLMNFTSGFPPFLTISFRDIQFLDPGTQTCCAIWNSVGALDIERCQFENLKYGVINNVAEWCRYYWSYFNGCKFGVYATSSDATNDPLGFTSGYITSIGGSNPSEQYFTDCWFNVCNCAYYEDQPTNPFDLGSDVYFLNCQLIGGNSVVVIIGVQQGHVTFDGCWFEGRAGTEPGITVHAVTYPSCIIYSEGTTVILREVIGITDVDQIYVKYSSGLNSATSQPPRLIFENTDFHGGGVVTVDDGVITSVSGGQMNGTDLSAFSSTRDVIPSGPTAATTKAVTFTPTVVPITPVQGNSTTGPYNNLWKGGSCAGILTLLYGVPTSAVITSGDGFISNKYLKLVGMANNNGITTADFTSVSNKIYFISGALRQVSGSTKLFLIGPTGGTDGPGAAGTVNVKSGGWQFFCAITGCNSGGATGVVRILNVNGSALDFDVSALQVIKFDTIEQAMIYANSGIFTIPENEGIVTAEQSEINTISYNTLTLQQKIGAITTDTFNIADSTTISLDATNLIATATGTTGHDSQIRGFYSQASPGKVHLEYTLTLLTNFTSVGIASASHSIVTGQYLGIDLSSVGVWNDGTVLLNNATIPGGQAILPGFNSGDTIAIEIDFGASPPLLWAANVTQNTGYNPKIGGGNPATGYNGVALTGLTNSPWFTCIDIEGNSDVVTMNTGGSPFLLAPSIGFGNYFSVSQGTPAAKTTSTTLTAAEILTGIITVNQGAAGASALQLPLATAMDTALAGSVVNTGLEFSLINISTNAAESASITTNTGWTLVGDMDVAANSAVTTKSAGRFGARKTATGAWTLYRLS